MELVEESILEEELAQCKFEKKKLEDELENLQRSSFSLEENVNHLSALISRKNDSISRYEKHNRTLLETLAEKEQFLEASHKEKAEAVERGKTLEEALIVLEGEKKDLEKENQNQRKKMKELVNKNAAMKKKLSNMEHEVNLLKGEKTTHLKLICDIHRELKVLEEEKGELQELVEFLTNKNNEHLSRCRAENLQTDVNSNILDNGCNDLNLFEELLLVETNKNQPDMINSREKLVNVDSAVLSRRRTLLWEKPKEILDVVFFWNKLPEGYHAVLSLWKLHYEKIVRELERRSEGRAGESNSLTEAPDSIRVKEAVINAQPIPNRIVESVSIATQTDRILLEKAFEEFGPIQNVPVYKYNDVDMDLYRSYRKLSILPEEEDDDTLKRVPSFKNTVNSKSFSAKLPNSFKTHSADDIINFEKRSDESIPSEKLISSCTNIILPTADFSVNGSANGTASIRGSPKPAARDFPTICDTSLSDANNSKSEVDSKDSQLTTLDPVEALRQPHSFDSYLDPHLIPNSSSSSLPRQTSDPTQGAAFDPPLTRRGSYLKRPRSTCRPLRLPCDSNGGKREERTSKVRFDLSNNTNYKPSDHIDGSKGPMPPSNLKNATERVSRFTVEVVDEDEFRKSIHESNKPGSRKRPPLVHSVVYKKAVLQDITVYDSDVAAEGGLSRHQATASPESPSYETATENSPAGSFDMATYETNYLIADIYPCKRRKQSDSSSYSIESQDSIDDDILVKSIRLHSNSEYITMKELDRASSASSHLSVDLDIPYIDAEELPVIKSNLSDAGNEGKETDDSEERSFDVTPKAESPVNRSDSSETFLTPCIDMTPTSETADVLLKLPKSSGLSKSPTVLKNLSNFEHYSTVSESMSQKKTSVRSQIVEEEEEASETNGGSESTSKTEDEEADEEESTIHKRTSSDASEMSDNMTYVTVRSDPSNIVLLGSDCDSDTYITIQSDKSALERKFSDLSENSSSPYNTPPDTSSASFCTPPDTYSPILGRLSKHLEGRDSPPSPPSTPARDDESPLDADTPPNLPSPYKTYRPQHRDSSESESVTIYNIDDSNYPSEKDDYPERKDSIIFDSPKLEFYETNDSIENLEAFLKTEEGLQELGRAASDVSWRGTILEDLQEESVALEQESKTSDAEEGSHRGGLSKANSLESPPGAGEGKFFEKRNKRHPPLSRQTSTEDYNFLEPHDSCLNLSEDMSSPSTTPDTSNKTVIFKNKHLALSNTIDLEDDDFPISESEIQINFNGSETEIVEITVGESSTRAVDACPSEPSIPSTSSTADASTGTPPQQSSSDESDEPGGSQPPPMKPEGFPGAPPEIIVSNISSDSDDDSDAGGGALLDFASNASDRSEINLSDLNSLSGHSDNPSSNSDPSDYLASGRSPELQITDPEISLSASPEISDDSSDLDLPAVPDPLLPEDLPACVTDSRPGLVVEPSDEATSRVCSSHTREPFLSTNYNKVGQKEDTQHPPEAKILGALSPRGSKRMSSQNSSTYTDEDEVCSTCRPSADSTENIIEEHQTIHGNSESAEDGECRETRGNLTSVEDSSMKEEEDPCSSAPSGDSKKDVSFGAGGIGTGLKEGREGSAFKDGACDSGFDAAVQSDLSYRGDVFEVDVDGKNALSEDEVERKFQELCLIFQGDVMLLKERLTIRKRWRDQAEVNFGREVALMETGLKNLFRCVSINPESMRQVDGLKKQLDVIVASANYLIANAEAYGYVQCEDKMSGAVAIMMKQMEYMERAQNELSKSPDVQRTNGRRMQYFPTLEDERQDERLPRRRSVASMASTGPRRRASIAILQRSLNLADDSNGSLNGSNQSLASNRSSGSLAKASFNQANAAKASGSPTTDHVPFRDASYGTLRCRKDSRMAELAMKSVTELFTNTPNSICDENEDLFASSDEDVVVEASGSLQLGSPRLCVSSPESRMRSSVAADTFNVIDSARALVNWNVFVIRNSRFQFPEHVHQSIPFLITWYVVVLVMTIFWSGFFVGSFSFQLLYSSSITFCYVASWISAASLIWRIRVLKLLAILISVIYTLQEALKVFVINRDLFEVHYPKGAPPV